MNCWGFTLPRLSSLSDSIISVFSEIAFNFLCLPIRVFFEGSLLSACFLPWRILEWPHSNQWLCLSPDLSHYSRGVYWAPQACRKSACTSYTEIFMETLTFGTPSTTLVPGVTLPGYSSNLVSRRSLRVILDCLLIYPNRISVHILQTPPSYKLSSLSLELPSSLLPGFLASSPSNSSTCVPEWSS